MDKPVTRPHLGSKPWHAGGTAGDDRATLPRFGLVAVYENPADANRAVLEARRVAGPRGRVRTGSHDDVIASLRGEMREEEEASTMGPGSVLGPQEATRSRVGTAILFAIVGAAVLVWVGLVPVAGVPMAARLGFAAGIGAAAGASIGFVAGALGAKDPRTPMAAERGVTVRVEAPHDTLDAVAKVLQTFAPIRIDRFELDEPPGPMPLDTLADAHDTRHRRGA